MTMSLPKKSIVFVLLFGLFYLEPIAVGPTTIAVLWKAPLIAVILIVLISSNAAGKLNKLTAWGFVFMVAGVFNESLIINPVETISFVIKNSYIPVIYGFCLYRMSASRRGIEWSQDYLLLLSVFVLISTVPFHLKLVSPISSGYDLSLFEDLTSGNFGFVGIFQKAHTASVTIAAATATLIWCLPYIASQRKRMFYLALISLGLVTLVLTLVRTGLAMIAIVLLALMFSSRKRTHVFLGLSLIITSTLAILYLFQTSETFQMRLLGVNHFMAQQDATFNQISSGRILYWTSALERFFSASTLEQFFGFGPTLSKDLMQKSVGLRIYAHNGFIDILQFYGYFGLFAYVMMLAQIFRVVFRLKRSDPYFALCIVHLGAYLMQMLVQGERVFLADVMFVLVLAIATGRAAIKKAAALRFSGSTSAPVPVRQSIQSAGSNGLSRTPVSARR